jgi:hypothetical protein
MTSVDIDEEILKQQDLVVILVPQVGVDWELVASASQVVLDCCNAIGRRGPTIERL